MRHGKRNNALGRKTAHRKSMLSNMACSLIEHKRNNTTLAKAKELRKFVEPLITKSKTDSTHSRRVVFSNLKSKDAVTELFREVAPKVNTRNGGYTRIIKLGTRLGDAAEMCMIELVDFNELMLKDSGTKTKRSRRGKKKTGSTETAAAKPEAKKEEAVAEEKSTKDAAPEAKATEDAPAETAAPEAKAETKNTEPESNDTESGENEAGDKKS